MCYLQQICVKDKYISTLEIKWQINIFFAKTKQLEAGIFVLILDKADIR